MTPEPAAAAALGSLFKMKMITASHSPNQTLQAESSKWQSNRALQVILMYSKVGVSLF